MNVRNYAGGGEVEQHKQDVEGLIHGIFLCAPIVGMRYSVCFCGVLLGYGDIFIFTLDMVSHVTTACHCAVVPAEEHLDSLFKSLVKEPLGNLNTDESLNDASSTRGSSSKTDGEFFLHLIPLVHSVL